MKHVTRKTAHLLQLLWYAVMLLSIWYVSPVSAQSNEKGIIERMAEQDYNDDMWTEELCSTALEFCAPLHKNFWYNVFTIEDKPGYGQAEFSIDFIEELGEGPIVIRVVTGPYVGASDTARVQNGVIYVQVERDADTHFVVEGPEELEDAVAYIAKYLRTVPAEDILRPKENKSHTGETQHSTSEAETTNVVPHQPAFLDVAEDYIYYPHIQKLYSVGVIQGNPDGTYAPDRFVNRAEMIVMLYRALNISPDTLNRLCFPDIDAAAWYALYVCDAAEEQHVAGYDDGLYRPGNNINKAEGLKILLEIFGIEPISVLESEVALTYVDVADTAWYYEYLLAAHEWNVFPIVGQNIYRFEPADHLTRGEVAAWIHAVLYQSDYYYVPPQEVEESAHEDTSEPEEANEEAEEEREEDTRNFSGEDPIIESIVVQGDSFTFEEQSAFDGKRTVAYRLEVSDSTTLSTTLIADEGAQSHCRLYRIEESGFAEEYYLGFQEQNKCSLFTTLSPGNYQLQLQPETADAGYHLEMRETGGDGNDGFSEAVTLRIPSTSTSLLQSGDIEDWYTFTLTHERRMNLTLDADVGQDVDCLVYPMGDVDLFGFNVPGCNEWYDYPSGTYFVSVRKKEKISEVQQYELSLDIQ